MHDKEGHFVCTLDRKYLDLYVYDVVISLKYTPIYHSGKLKPNYNKLSSPLSHNWYLGPQILPHRRQILLQVVTHLDHLLEMILPKLNVDLPSS